jgi:hypothetical protein
MKFDNGLSKSNRALIAIYHLESKKTVEKKITVEDVAVELWKEYPTEFCMKGYPEYPNVDIQKYITKLLANNLIVGGVYNYSITHKGIEVADQLSTNKTIKTKPALADVRRDIKAEIERIVNSKIFQYYINTKKPDFVESDLFEFMGTSSRSLNTHNDSTFLRKYNMIINDVIPFCKKNKDSDKNMKAILEIWTELAERFKSILSDANGHS